MQKNKLNLYICFCYVINFCGVVTVVSAMPDGTILGFKPCDPGQNDPMCHAIGQFGAKCSDMYPCARGLYCKRRYKKALKNELLYLMCIHLKPLTVVWLHCTVFPNFRSILLKECQEIIFCLPNEIASSFSVSVKQPGVFKWFFNLSVSNFLHGMMIGRFTRT